VNFTLNGQIERYIRETLPEVFMANEYAPKELLPYMGLFYRGIKENERQGCDVLFKECSKKFGDGSVDEFVRQTYIYLSSKKRNLSLIAVRAPENYSINLRNIEIILENIEKVHPEYTIKTV